MFPVQVVDGALAALLGDVRGGRDPQEDSHLRAQPGAGRADRTGGLGLPRDEAPHGRGAMSEQRPLSWLCARVGCGQLVHGGSQFSGEFTPNTLTLKLPHNRHVFDKERK